MQQFGASSALT